MQSAESVTVQYRTRPGELEMVVTTQEGLRNRMRCHMFDHDPKATIMVWSGDQWHHFRIPDGGVLEIWGD